MLLQSAVVKEVSGKELISVSSWKSYVMYLFLNLGLKGKTGYSDNGEANVELTDMYDVFKKIKGTPRYWALAKSELVAKVKQLGPFHVFFTFSCGEMRWTEVFLSVFKREGLDVSYPKKWDGNDADILVEGTPLWDYVNSVMSKTKHQLFKDYTFLITRMFDARVKSLVNNILMGGGKDKIPFQYYSYRVEFQARGMPHIHGVAWIDKDWLRLKGIADICDEKNEAIVLTEIVDKMISCQLPEDDPNLKKIVSEVQKHKHTKSCLKYNGKCRYDFPKLPSPKTILAKPLSENDGTEEERTQKRENANSVLAKAKSLLDTDDLDENMSFETFLEEIGTTEELYLEYLGITSKGRVLVLKRSIKERFVNNYNTEMLACWDANMDIQLALEPFAIITYIVSYVLKDEKGMTKFLKEALKSTVSKNVKEKLKALKETYMTHRQIGASEAAYRAIPDMRLKDSNIGTFFVATGYPENRSVFYKRVEEKDEEKQICIDDDFDQFDDDLDFENNDDFEPMSKPVRIKERDGLYQTAVTVHERYAARSKSLESMCLAQFAIEYSYSKTPPKDTVFIEGSSTSLSSKTIFNSDIFLPTCICLEPKRLGFMKLKRTFKVLRNHTSKKKEGVEEHYSEMLLFSAWRNEIRDLKRDVKECYNQYLEKRIEIDSNRKALYPGESKIDYLEDQELEVESLRPVHIYDMLASQCEQQNNDDLEEGVTDDPKYESFGYTGNLNLEGTGHIENCKYKKICLPNDSEICSITRRLVPEQMDVLKKVISGCKDVVKCRTNLSVRPKPVRLILLGGQGKYKFFQFFSNTSY